jgi:hypothetical protein
MPIAPTKTTTISVHFIYGLNPKIIIVNGNDR